MIMEFIDSDDRFNALRFRCQRDNQVTSDNISNVHPQKIIILDRGDYTSCTVNLHGATLTSWRIKNQEMIFISRESHFTGLSHIRGGIQFVFPVMGEWLFGPNHGFARDLPWSLEEGPEKLDTGDVYAIVRLTANPYTHAMWGYRFKLYYKITLYEYKIVFNIGVENSSKIYPFEFSIMQHSLLRVPDVSKCEVIGFKNCKYKDCLKNNQLMTEDREIVTISGHIDRIYVNAPNVVTVTNVAKGGKLRIVKKRTRDINVWNPWMEKSSTIADLGNDEFLHFIAVEAGIVSKPVRIEPLSCWEAYQTFEFVEPKKEKVVEDFFDLFDGYC